GRDPAGALVRPGRADRRADRPGGTGRTDAHDGQERRPPRGAPRARESPRRAASKCLRINRFCHPLKGGFLRGAGWGWGPDARPGGPPAAGSGRGGPPDPGGGGRGGSSHFTRTRKNIRRPVSHPVRELTPMSQTEPTPDTYAAFERRYLEE